VKILIWRKYKYVIIAIPIVFFICLGLVYLSNYYAAKNFNYQQETISYKDANKPVYIQAIQKRYTLCGHITPLEFQTEQLNVLNLEDLKRAFPAEAGWKIEPDPTGAITITQIIYGLCPVDAQKRHLGELAGFVSVYIGPAGTNGGLDRITNIKLINLPKDWQQLIKNNAIEFANEKDLLEALDNLDEYLSS
jgi:hypothetical protein